MTKAMTEAVTVNPPNPELDAEVAKLLDEERAAKAVASKFANVTITARAMSQPDIDIDRSRGRQGRRDDRVLHSAADGKAFLVHELSASRQVVFFVPGDPQAKGDKIILGAKTAKPWLAERNAGPKANWRAHAADLARAARGERPLFDEAIRVTMTVLRLRPKSHYGSGKNAGALKANAPTYPTSAPDLDKLQRSLGDALNGVLWRDDAQISSWRVARRWGTEAGIMVIVQPEFEP